MNKLALVAIGTMGLLSVLLGWKYWNATTEIAALQAELQTASANLLVCKIENDGLKNSIESQNEKIDEYYQSTEQYAKRIAEMTVALEQEAQKIVVYAQAPTDSSADEAIQWLRTQASSLQY